ncbi:indolepyruvate ferredoxin oxidoreductase subunit alpha [Sulfolobus acidocaldarius]|uniref:Indolepyruvate oxidoreductase subunit IorA n=4 Tax=Sulfolobus acidocaldarius TaxID=2285 RepID=Q4J6R6_SULAC|nr:indolepyruvate ferredoxin oxidoreductase subunit alpha [Sulfolobus acidocaldarius]AAY81515.1 indolepyruvate ferredoxin oxidoreductase alpha [Sulfolobus acidocaldarius DSM 639]AGE72118.1 thiamine pyrophosphate protein domain protein TPP-binding protein [Sulfolobus acidocaldarius N8]AGE74435.1 thiamine pyrophosphate protein domain protein TPP-binding protein [Sulfolobus acidocaldarius Ron12/I]ALU30603.1 indolepyruvate ferredoxin oxidoreductase subunit alpha [Sulfolobus acidocaldarius]ALU32864
MITSSLARQILLGNEAIALASLASGVSVAAGYPGTPSTEILETIQKHSRNVYVEWSANEKVAFETAYGAAINGAYALTTMKHVGLNVAADPLMSSSYTGVEGAFVIVSADDPSMWSSQNEQDNRYYGLHGLIPVIEPYDPQSAYNLMIEAFKLSAKVKHPVIFRTTTRISHVRAPVSIKPPINPIYGKVTKNPKKYVLVPENARRNRMEQLKRWEMIKEEVENLNEYEDNGSKDLIIASGISYSFVKDAMNELNIRANLLRISTPVPIPSKLILKAVSEAERVLIVEEVEPIVEYQVKDLLYDHGIRVELHGKDIVSKVGEMTLDKVYSAFSRFFDLNLDLSFLESPSDIPQRPPALCPGCPHRSSFVDLKKALSMTSMSNAFISGDIGCYTLGLLPPFEEQDSSTDMGSSVGIANGVYRATGNIPVAIIGDSTFFHSGMSGLANAVYNKTPLVLLVLDNRSTAMTGQQPSPSKEIDIGEVAKGLGVRFVKYFDPFEMNSSVKSLTEAIEWVKKNKEPAVIIAKRACALLVTDVIDDNKLPKAVVDMAKCTGCTICYDYFTCPAIIPRKDKKAEIDVYNCIGCGACVPVCPFKAISIKGDKPEGWDKLWLE